MNNIAHDFFIAEPVPNAIRSNNNKPLLTQSVIFRFPCKLLFRCLRPKREDFRFFNNPYRLYNHISYGPTHSQARQRFILEPNPSRPHQHPHLPGWTHTRQKSTLLHFSASLLDPQHLIRRIRFMVSTQSCDTPFAVSFFTKNCPGIACICANKLVVVDEQGNESGTWHHGVVFATEHHFFLKGFVGLRYHVVSLVLRELKHIVERFLKF